jgi:hypothetical protein
MNDFFANARGVALSEFAAVVLFVALLATIAVAALGHTTRTQYCKSAVSVALANTVIPGDEEQAERWLKEAVAASDWRSELNCCAFPVNPVAGSPELGQFVCVRE